MKNKTIDDYSKAGLLECFFSQTNIEKLQKINDDKRFKEETRERRRYDLLASEIPYGSLVSLMRGKINKDALEITSKIDELRNNPMTPDSSEDLSLNSFDKVSCFDQDPVEGTEANKLLRGTKGVYVFIMKEDYSVQSGFDDIEKGAPRRDKAKTLFKKGEILYIGRTESLLKRMHAHFGKDSSGSNTGAIKLSSKKRWFEG